MRNIPTVVLHPRPCGWPSRRPIRSHPPEVAAPAAPPPWKKPTAQPKFTDQQLEALIRTKFAKSKSTSQFKVHVQDGVATIEGKTDVIQHKGSATGMTKVAGAAVVNNNVEVSDSAKKPPPGTWRRAGAALR